MSWPVKGAFTISRSSLTMIPTVWVELTEGSQVGRAECRPYDRYGDTVGSVIQQIECLRDQIEAGLDTEELQGLIPPGPARNAVDCALWDLKSKQSGQTVSDLLKIPKPKPRTTAYTLSLQTPSETAAAAREARDYPILKVKVDGQGAVECVQAVLDSRPDASLIIDANEGMSRSEVDALTQAIPNEAILMLEQPISSAISISPPFSSFPVVCADESLHSQKEISISDLEKLHRQGYRAINVKLDKCGGLTAALSLMQLAKQMDFQIMAGCMVGSSLAMAPMLILESYADVLDLDGPLLLAEDCKIGLTYQGSKVLPPPRELWG